MTDRKNRSPFNLTLAITTLALTVLGGWSVWQSSQAGSSDSAASTPLPTVVAYENTPSKGTAIFAGGCFWCVESDFDHVPGVLETTSGYIGGTTPNPTYKSVTYGNAGHLEAVKITFDPTKVSYDALLHTFWRNVDPTDDGGQFCDRGDSYKTEIFATTPEQLTKAKASKQELIDTKRLAAPIVTPIRRAGPFTAAETYHQDYYEKSPLQYKVYRYRCGRDARIRNLWGDEAHAGIVKKGS